jgi:eukaryotic-like serine/threonine-protein kinase
VIEAIVGSGGFGTVVRAHDTELDREVAIKCVPTPEPERAYDLVKAEAQALARVRAPEVVTVHDCIRAHVETIQGRRPCVAIVMEYVPGSNLRKWMQDLHEREDKLSVLVSAAKGVEAAHAAGLIHRDLKPENVLVTAHNQARIVDFGLAYRLTETARVTALSQRGSFGLGTPQYMAPEALHGSVTPRADQFSFAVMAWELLTGTLPFASATPGGARRSAGIRRRRASLS